MLKRQKEMLQRVMVACEKMGGDLDATATHPRKYRDRQSAHNYVFWAIYGILSDEPENPQREWDLESAEDAIQKLEEIAGKEYPDRSGNYRF